MAKIEALITADIHPLERAFAEAKAKARELGKGISEVGSDLGKGVTGFDLGKALGVGGAIYAAGKLGDALVDAAKEGFKAFQAYQDAVLKFKYNLPSSAGTLEQRGQMGAEMAETAESKVGIFSFAQLTAAGIALEQVAGELKASPEKINELVDTMQALAIKTGATPDVIAENFRKLVVGIKEEGGAAVGKFFKATPGMEEEVGKLRDAHAQAYLKAQGVTQGTASPAQAAEFAKLLATPIAEFMTKESERVGGTAVLEEIKGILERSAPKDITKEEEAIHPEKMLAAAFEKIHTAFGEKLAPTINELVNVLTQSMPTIKDDFAELAEVMSTAIPVLTFFGEVISGVNMVIAGFMRTVGGFLGTKQSEILGTDTQRSVDARLKSMGIDSGSMLKGNAQPGAPPISTNPSDYTGGLYFGKEAASPGTPSAPSSDAIEAAATKAQLNAAAEAQKAQIKSDAEHAASAAQIMLEATQSAFQQQTRGAVQSAMSRVNPEDKSLAGKEYGEQQAGAVKVIDIQAAAAAKIRVLDEESARKIAKIKEEAALRGVTRASEDAQDVTDAQKAARDKVRLAEDSAAQQSIADLQADAAQKIRDENQDAVDKIIDAQEASAKTIGDTIRSYYEGLIAKHEGPYTFTPDEGPAAEETYNTFGKGGRVIEGSFERKQREAANKAGQAAVDKANEDYQRQQEAIALAAVRKPGVSSGTGAGGLPGANSISVNVAYDPKTGDKTTSFDFGKGVSEQVKTNVILGEIYKELAVLDVS